MVLPTGPSPWPIFARFVRGTILIKLDWDAWFVFGCWSLLAVGGSWVPWGSGVPWGSWVPWVSSVLSDSGGIGTNRPVSGLMKPGSPSSL